MNIVDYYTVGNINVKIVAHELCQTVVGSNFPPPSEVLLFVGIEKE